MRALTRTCCVMIVALVISSCRGLSYSKNTSTASFSFSAPTTSSSATTTASFSAAMLSATLSSTFSGTSTETESISVSESSTGSQGTATWSPSVTSSGTRSPSWSYPASASKSPTVTFSKTPSVSWSRTATLSPASVTASTSVSDDLSRTRATSTATLTRGTLSPSAFKSFTQSKLVSATPVSPTKTLSTSPSHSWSPSGSPSPSLTASPSRESSISATSSCSKSDNTHQISMTYSISSSGSNAPLSASSSSSYSVPLSPSHASFSSSSSNDPSLSSTRSFVVFTELNEIVEWVSARPTGAPPSAAVTFFTIPNTTSLVEGTIPHDNLRYQGFTLSFFLRDAIAPRFFADAPPITVHGPSAGRVNYTSLASKNAIEVILDRIDYNRYDQQTIKVQFGPYPKGKLPEPLFFTLVVTPVEPSVSTSLRTVVTGFGVGGAILSASPLVASSLSRSTVMSGVVVCTQGAQNSYLSLLNAGVGANDAGYFYRGAVAGNLGLAGLMVAIPFVISGLIGASARPKKRRDTWLRCLELLHLPSFAIVAGQLTLQPTITASVALLVAWNTYSDIAVGCVGVAALTMYLSWVTMSYYEAPSLSLRSRPPLEVAVSDARIDQSRHRTFRRPIPPWPVVERLTSTVERIRQSIRGAQHWTATLVRWKTWKREHYLLLSLYDTRWIGVFEMWMLTAMAVLTGVTIDSEAYCVAHLSLLAAGYVILIGAHVYWLPSLTLRNHVSLLTVYCMWLSSSALALLGLVLHDGDGSSVLLDAATVFNTATIVLSLLNAVPDALYTMLKAPHTVFQLYHAAEYHHETDPRKAKAPFVAIPGPPTPPRTPPPPPPTPAEALPPVPPVPMPRPPRRPPTLSQLKKLHVGDVDAMSVDTMSPWTSEHVELHELDEAPPLKWSTTANASLIHTPPATLLREEWDAEARNSLVMEAAGSPFRDHTRRIAVHDVDFDML